MGVVITNTIIEALNRLDPIRSFLWGLHRSGSVEHISVVPVIISVVPVSRFAYEVLCFSRSYEMIILLTTQIVGRKNSSFIFNVGRIYQELILLHSYTQFGFNIIPMFAIYFLMVYSVLAPNLKLVFFFLAPVFAMRSWLRFFKLEQCSCREKGFHRSDYLSRLPPNSTVFL